MACRRCGKCCKTIGAEIPEPETLADFEDIKWYLYHKGISVYIDRDNTWNIEIQTDCKFLDTDNGCKIYENKPPICNEFDPSKCEIEVNEKNETSNDEKKEEKTIQSDPESQEGWVDVDAESDDNFREFETAEDVDEYVNELKEKGLLKEEKD